MPAGSAISSVVASRAGRGVAPTGLACSSPARVSSEPTVARRQPRPADVFHLGSQPPGEREPPPRRAAGNPVQDRPAVPRARLVALDANSSSRPRAVEPTHDLDAERCRSRYGQVHARALTAGREPWRQPGARACDGRGASLRSLGASGSPGVPGVPAPGRGAFGRENLRTLEEVVVSPRPACGRCVVSGSAGGRAPGVVERGPDRWRRGSWERSSESQRWRSSRPR